MREDLIFGFHVVRHLLDTRSEQLLEIFLIDSRTDSRGEEILQKAQQTGVSLHRVPKKQLDNWLPEINHQGVAARIRRTAIFTENDLSDLVKVSEAKHLKPLFLVLDSVQDPHNLGACLRTADAAGVTAVIIPKDKSVSITPVVRKVACGAADSVPIIIVTNLVRALEQLKEMGVWIMGTSLNTSKSLYEVDLKGSVAIVLGAEGTGLRRLTEEHCDVLMQIPMLGMVESLNVSVATGICLYEAVRQRRMCVA